MNSVELLTMIKEIEESCNRMNDTLYSMTVHINKLQTDISRITENLLQRLDKIEPVVEQHEDRITILEKEVFKAK